MCNSASVLVPADIQQTTPNLGAQEAILLVTDFVGQDLSSIELHAEPQLGMLGG